MRPWCSQSTSLNWKGKDAQFNFDAAIRGGHIGLQAAQHLQCGIEAIAQVGGSIRQNAA